MLPSPRATPPPRRIHPTLSLGLLAGLLTGGCGESGTTPPESPELPVIQIQGVEEGGVFGEPVTITFSVSPSNASATAELNGRLFRSGDRVSRAGDYTLRVEAFLGGRTVEEAVRFSMAPSGDRILILRLFDLGFEGLGGGGDAILLSDSSSLGTRHGLVDAGPRGDRGQPLQEAHVAEQLLALGVDTLEFLQLTHAHADHFAGMVPVLDRVHVQRFIYNGQVRSFSGYQQVLNRATQRADTVLVLEQDWEHILGGAGGPRTVHISPLDSYLEEDTNDGRMLNEGSLGTFVELNGLRLFLTGDGEDEANLRWRTRLTSLTGDLDVLKVGHHGANNAVFDNRTGFGNTASAWLEHTRPSLMLISANGRSHPRQNATARLLEVPLAKMYCTSVHGLVEVRFTPSGWTVIAERNTDQDCVPGEEANT